MQRATLFLLILTICHCFDTRPMVEYSSLTYYSDQSGAYLLSFGGESNLEVSSDLWRYSLTHSKWELALSNGSPFVFQHAAVIRTISNSMLVFGGYNSSVDPGILIPNTYLYEYFPANNTWNTRDDNFTIPSDFSATYVESLDALLVYGSEYPNYYNTLQYYFLGNKTWSTIPTQTAIPRYSLVNAIYMPETQTVYSLGGYNITTIDDQEVLAQFMSVSIAGNNSWITLNNPGPIASAVLVAAYPYVYAYGGCRKFGFDFHRGVFCADVSSDVMKYDVNTGEWSIEPTNVVRTDTVGVLTPKRVLYLYGGHNRENKFVGDLQHLDLSEPVVTVESEEIEKRDRIGVIVGSVIAGLVAISGVALYVVYRKRQSIQDLSIIPLVSKTQDV